jgi:hypothetical protein
MSGYVMMLERISRFPAFASVRVGSAIYAFFRYLHRASWVCIRYAFYGRRGVHIVLLDCFARVGRRGLRYTCKACGVKNPNAMNIALVRTALRPVHHS